MDARHAPPELHRLAEEIGTFIRHWGFKRIHGKIWTHLCLSKNPLDASDLIDRLKVSKALVSMSLADLVEYSVIEEAGRSSRGTTLYRINPDVLGVIRDVLRNRERELLSRIASAHREVRRSARDGRRGEVHSDRMQALGKLIRGATRALDGYLVKQRFDLRLTRRFFLE